MIKRLFIVICCGLLLLSCSSLTTKSADKNMDKEYAELIKKAAELQKIVDDMNTKEEVPVILVPLEGAKDSFMKEFVFYCDFYGPPVVESKFERTVDGETKVRYLKFKDSSGTTKVRMRLEGGDLRVKIVDGVKYLEITGGYIRTIDTEEVENETPRQKEQDSK